MGPSSKVSDRLTISYLGNFLRYFVSFRRTQDKIRLSSSTNLHVPDHLCIENAASVLAKTDGSVFLPSYRSACSQSLARNVLLAWFSDLI